MKTAIIWKHLLLSVMLIVKLTASGQARLVLNGAQMVITNNAALVVANDAPDAITRLSGSIISEGEGNRVQWMIGQTTGTYTLPWGHGSVYFPLTFTKGASSGAGKFVFSTFPTPPQNSLNLPIGVTDMNRSGKDRSLFFVDRFWQLSAEEYSSRPHLTDVQFSYVDAEHALPNTIIESALGASRWNDVTNTWDGYGPAGVANVSGNTVTVAGIANTDLYKWWSLIGQDSALPVRYLSFTTKLQRYTVHLQWTTGDEVDVGGYEIQRSVNGNDFTPIGTAAPIGGGGPNIYFYKDDSPAPGRNVYRIKETGKNGSFHFSPVRSVIVKIEPRIEVFPNPVTETYFNINATEIPTGKYTIQLFALDGKLEISSTKHLNGGYVRIELDRPLPDGTYTLKVSSRDYTFATKLVVNRY